MGLHLDVTFQGVPISVHIGDKQVAVEVREKVYSITYFVSICQAVILDHRTRQVKFWEEKGYSARKEGLGSLLRGGTYIAKSPDQEICVVGYHFKDFFEGELFEEHLRQVLDGQAPGFSDVAYEINGFALLASILPIRDGEEIAGIIAKSIQQVQPRGGPFLRTDCSAVAPGLLEEQLFGREGGVPGSFLEADGGTLLLDEVGGLPMNVQAKLLYAIRRREIMPVGASTPVPVDVRLLFIAGPELRDEVDSGRFRQDLYYRLSAFSVEMPSLRDHKEDIYLLANQLTEQICQRYHISEKTLSGEAFSKLINYDWPGNLRELENVLEGAAALSDSDIIYPEHIHLPTESAPLTLRQHLRQEEKRFIQQVLAQCGGDRQKAMKQLDLSRSVFYERLKEYGLR